MPEQRAVENVNMTNAEKAKMVQEELREEGLDTFLSASSALSKPVNERQKAYDEQVKKEQRAQRSSAAKGEAILKQTGLEIFHGQKTTAPSYPPSTGRTQESSSSSSDKNPV